MTQEQIENLQDAWFSCRDVHDETGNEEVKAIMDRLHVLIDNELDKQEMAENEENLM